MPNKEAQKAKCGLLSSDIRKIILSAKCAVFTVLIRLRAEEIMYQRVC